MLLKQCANHLKITTKIVFSLQWVAGIIVLINIQVKPDFQAHIMITMSLRNQAGAKSCCCAHMNSFFGGSTAGLSGECKHILPRQECIKHS